MKPIVVGHNMTLTLRIVVLMEEIRALRNMQRKMYQSLDSPKKSMLSMQIEFKEIELEACKKIEAEFEEYK